ncbi:MAG: RNA polymerase sigma factor [Polyangiales bacterium]
MSLTIPTPTVPNALAEATHETPAFDRLFRDEAPYVGRTLRYLDVEEDQVEDACQDVFIVVHRRLAEFQGGSLRAWVRQICVHVANNRRRGRRRRPESTVAEMPEVAAPASQLDAAERGQIRERVLSLLDRLSPDQRTVFVLCEIEQLTVVEASSSIGCPVQTAYSRLHAARAKVEAALKVGRR